MAKWKKESFQLRADHKWKAKPGYKIFVADRGAVRFDIPVDWVMQPGEAGSIQFLDRQPPADDCRLEVSILRTPPGIDWSGLPLPTVLLDSLKADGRDIDTYGPMHHIRRQNLELAWIEASFIDPGEQRPACSRACLASVAGVFPFMTMDMWRDDLDRFSPVWDEVLRSLQLGNFIADPTRGPRLDD